MAPVQPDTLTRRYVAIPCPSGKHARSLVTFGNHAVAAMFCIPCEHAWTESTLHPLIESMERDDTRLLWQHGVRPLRPRRQVSHG